LLLGFVRCFFSSTRPRSDRNNRSTTLSSSSFLLLFLLLLRDMIATTSFSATFNLVLPFFVFSFCGEKIREKATTNSPLQSFSRRRGFCPRVCFVYELLLARIRRRQKKKKRRRRRRDRRRGNKRRSARFSPSSFLSLLLSLSLSGSSF